MSLEGAQTSDPCRHEPFTPLQFCDRPEGVFAEPVDRENSRTFVATEQAIVELEDAAERGVPSALWKLGLIASFPCNHLRLWQADLYLCRGPATSRAQDTERCAHCRRLARTRRHAGRMVQHG